MQDQGEIVDDQDDEVGSKTLSRMPPVWRTEPFLSAFRAAYQTMDLTTPNKPAVIHDWYDTGHQHEVKGESKEIASNLWGKLEEQLLERRLQQMPLSTIPSLVASLKLISDPVSLAALSEVVPILTALDMLNNRYVDLSKTRNNQRGEQLQYSLEMEILGQLRESIEGLHTGDRVALPGGGTSRWCEWFYLVKREGPKGDTFSFTVFNSTETVQHHAAKTEKGASTRYCGTMTVTNIPRARLLNDAVLHFISRLKIDDQYGNFDDGRALYQVLTHYFLLYTLVSVI